MSHMDFPLKILHVKKLTISGEPTLKVQSWPFIHGRDPTKYVSSKHISQTAS